MQCRLDDVLTFAIRYNHCITHLCGASRYWCFLAPVLSDHQPFALLAERRHLSALLLVFTKNVCM